MTKEQEGTLIPTSGKTPPAYLQKSARICQDMLQLVFNKLGKLGKSNQSGPS